MGSFRCCFDWDSAFTLIDIAEPFGGHRKRQDKPIPLLTGVCSNAFAFPEFAAE